MRCRELSLAFPDKALDGFRSELRGLDALQELREAETRFPELEASKVEQLIKIDALESHDQEPLGYNRRFAHQSFLVWVKKERHEVLDVERTEAFTFAKVELKNVQEAIHVLKTRPHTDWCEIHVAIEDRDRVQSKLATAAGKLQVSKRVLTPKFSHLE